MDFVEGLPVSKGKSFILAVVDRLLKYAHFILLSHPHTAKGVAQVFIDQVFKLHEMSRTIHSAIKTTPFEVVYGRPPPSLLTYVSSTARIETIGRQLLDRDLIIKELRATLKDAQNPMKRSMTVITRRENLQKEIGKNLKLSQRYCGQYMIVKKIGVVAYKLDLPKESCIHPVFHVSLLKKRMGKGIPVQSELPTVRKDDDILHPRPQALID
ncbi:hypothetical protein AMTRI_Chr07g80290 [Amborella trichopoda]